MSAWGDSELLVELLDRQAKFVLDLSGRRQLIRLRHFIEFLRTEPRLKSILDDFGREAEEAAEEHHRRDALIRDVAAAIWNEHAAEMTRKVAGAPIDQVNNFGSMETFSARVATPPPCGLKSFRDDALESTSRLVRSLDHWWNHRRGECVDQGHTQSETQGKISALKARSEFEIRDLHELRSSLPGPCFDRLREAAESTNPRPPPEEADLAAHAQHSTNQNFAKLLDEADERGLSGTYEGTEVDEHYEQVVDDIRVLYEELRARIGLQRSRVALVKRFATRCEAYDAKELREEAEHDPQNAERVLTLRLAKYLFDAGLNPLIDPTISELRPDIIDTDSRGLLYVEAKQYARDPRAILKKGYAQVWGTWGRLRNRYAVREAFVVVFRRGGPLVTIPEVIEHDGLRLHTVVVDISGSGGSKERESPVEIRAEALLPIATPPTAEDGKSEAAAPQKNKKAIARRGATK